MKEGIIEMKNEIKVEYKELFVLADLDSYHYAAVIIDLKTYQFYNALFEGKTIGGGTGYYPSKTGDPISYEQVRKLADKSQDSRAKAYLGITNDNWKEIIGEE